MRRSFLAYVAALIALVPVLVGVLPGTAGAVEIKTVTTPLGLKAWLVQDKTAPAVSLAFSFSGGTASDPAGKLGVTSLMAALLTDGAAGFDAQTFRLRVEEAGASIGFGASLDRLNGALRVLSANRDDGFELLRLALTEPRFDRDMLDQRRAQMLSGLNRAKQSPGAVAARTFVEAEFAGHPYANDPDGTPEDLKGLATEDVRQRAKALLTRNGLIIAAVGDIDEAELARLLDRTFGGLPQEAPDGTPPALPPDWRPPAKARTIVVERPVPQSTALLGLPSLTRDDPDWYALLVLNHVLGGGGQQSRLFNEVREKRGLAYGASSSLRTYRKAGLLVISTASANERVAEALKVVRDVLSRLRDEGPTEEEFAEAKTYLTGSLALALDSSGAIAGLLHSMQVDQLPPNQLERRAALIDAVTIGDVQRLARRLLDQDRMITVVVGQPVGLSP
ncbi:MAG: insulinase family protein [Alphaproteobacteria bacterium]|nr:insulinase family protein [Alphaproteobacteria bacterium]MBV8409968.1 insulinase family protein [Alphaproteobacteria bacterium]